MNRRDALARVALLMGGAVIGGDYFLTSCSSPAEEKAKKGTAKETKQEKPFLSPDQVAYLNEVGETILPTTATPGAKAADVGSFMAVMVRDCYKPEDQQIFLKGLNTLEQASMKKNGKGFLESDAAQRTALLTALDAEQKNYGKTKTLEAPNHYFRMIKELTMLGYFTSEVGSTQALRYLPIPGKYEGCVPYKKGDRAWATT
ncbi:gluconate 2-dehydrogenase subunit 3 family protein [Hymenobacter taeanensis]|uniref:Gluconate 2-dehydrogenase subunit 3 family protein n=1 Tax=Hymenobacter taeanensis TaxID=2735321 RepID=A0A6M6BKX0_9BACT|nr:MULTISPECIES: gluconate 2-dehydrogenase subunit 3 family protein [Hymenobacter]QJX48093.1 gluconate 2-dehydrogenase subunit 3 family protein [Hymenobacter taeanensis]UOQ82441.1 gluconate 2-dehydrogenase subunit 3 family protein [Hymenobacter sp. 5414T-23]